LPPIQEAVSPRRYASLFGLKSRLHWQSLTAGVEPLEAAVFAGQSKQEIDMKSGIRTIQALPVAMLLGIAALPVCVDAIAASQDKNPETGFRAYDTNRDGYLSLKEFQDKGLDELAFKAADIDGDARVDPDEHDQYLKAKAADRLKSGSGAAAQPKPAVPKPAQPPVGY
jgi:hypothetical protein